MKEQNIYLPDELSFSTLLLSSHKNNIANIFVVDYVPQAKTDCKIENEEINLFLPKDTIANIYISSNKLSKIEIKDTLIVNILIKKDLENPLNVITYKTSSVILKNVIKNTIGLRSHDLSVIEFQGKFSHLDLLSYDESSIFGNNKKNKAKSLSLNALNSSKINVRNVKYKFINKRADFNAEVID